MPIKRARKAKRRVRKTRKPKYNQIVRLSRSTQLSTVHIPAGVGDMAFSYNFSLSQLPNVFEYAALFDSYRIDKVVLRFVPSQTVSHALGDATCMMVIANDYDDSTLPSTINELMEKPHRFLNLSNTEKPYIKHTLKPAINIGTSDAVQLQGKWIDSGTTTFEHLGVKGWLHQNNETNIPGNNPAFNLECYATYYVSLKQQR